jgi:murein DD-endopeptidase MepM/ murein hydrolase activator NlpD
MVDPVSSSNNSNRPGDHLSPSGFDYNRIDGVQGNPNVTEAFISEVEAMAERLGTQPEYLMAVMSFETGGSFSPAQRNNAGGSATGLIQFMPGTASELGTTTGALARMTPVEQLRYVEQYFNNRSDRGDLNTLEGVYTTVLYGSPRPDPNSTLFSQGSAAYRANAPLDLNRDGRITAGEATSFVRGRINGEAPPPTETPPGETPTEPSPPPGGSGNYTVRSGDTLSGIAQRHGVSLSALIAANPQISNPNLIHAGQQINIPGGGNGNGNGAHGGNHTVRSGETLSGIAQQHGVSLNALINANPQIRNPDLIYPGQTVHMPGGGGNGNGAQNGNPNPEQPPPPSGDTPTYAPYTVYSTGERPAFAVNDPDQLQPHHDYQTKVRDGQTLEVRDVVLHRNGQSQTQQAIPAPIAGEVIHAGPMGTAGNAVVIRGDNGQLTYIFHMSSIDVRAGQRVGYGQDLGNQGSTGHSTGPHVHIEAPPAVIDRWVNDLIDGSFDGRRGGN